MLSDHDLNGRHLPEKSLCLTYDDGPGTHTRKLGRYLADNGIQTTFFVIGQVAADQPKLLRELCDWGHLIGNHTWSHPGLVDLVLQGGDAVAELARTDAVIRPLLSPPIFFRPPYGSWRSPPRGPSANSSPTSCVAPSLRASQQFDDYLGPIMWDIVGEDWRYWQEGRSVEECLQRHLEEIDRIGRGIVLLHDSSEDPIEKAHNRTAELTMLLVPALCNRGYRFEGLETVFREAV
jgi:peptidoglycan/xylan/chitin deacetylase (PgdA/CDA1 family)